MTDANRIEVHHLERLCAASLEALGVPAADAAIVATLLVKSEGEGAVSHGLLRLPPLLQRLLAKSVMPVTPMSVVRESATTAILDAGDGIGQVAAQRAMEAAIRKADAHDIGIVTVINGGNFGRAGHPAVLAAEHGMIGIAASNASSRVVPSENMKPILGNNPWSVAIPTQGVPVVVDMANSIVAAGKIRVAKNEGQSIPEGWATDASGKMTTDPAAALTGALIAFGGYKGWSLSLIIDMLTGVLSGGAYGNDVGAPDDLDRPQKSAYFFMAIKIGSFMDLPQFQARSQDLVQRLKSASNEDVRMPGENSSKNYAAALSGGVAVRASAIKTLDKIFSDIGLGGWDDLLAKTRQ